MQSSLKESNICQVLVPACDSMTTKTSRSLLAGSVKWICLVSSQEIASLDLSAYNFQHFSFDFLHPSPSLSPSNKQTSWLIAYFLISVSCLAHLPPPRDYPPYPVPLLPLRRKSDHRQTPCWMRFPIDLSFDSAASLFDTTTKLWETIQPVQTDLPLHSIGSIHKMNNNRLSTTTNQDEDATDDHEVS